MESGIRLSGLREDVDRALVHRWLSEQSYWALGRPRATQDAAIDASRNYSAFDTASGSQIAYARVVTDAVTFAWLCDVFVAPDHRARGVGRALIDFVTDDLAPLGLKRIALATADAQSFYARAGFAPLAQPERWMAR